MSHYDGLPEGVAARIRVGIQIIPVSTPALKGVMFYQPPQMVLETDPAFGTEFHRPRYPWLAAYLADPFGSLRFCVRSEPVDARPMDGAPYALTLSHGTLAPLPGERPAGLSLDPTGSHPRFLGTWVDDAISWDRGCPGEIIRSEWHDDLLNRCALESARALDALVRPFLTEQERDAWSLIEASVRYDRGAHDALRVDTPAAARLRAYAGRQPFFCGEILSHEEARLAVLEGASDREVAAAAKGSLRMAGANGLIDLLPPSHIVALAKGTHRSDSYNLPELFRWYAGLPLEWLPGKTEEADAAYAFEMARDLGFAPVDVRHALPGAGQGWAKLRGRLETLSGNLGTLHAAGRRDHLNVIKRMLERFGEGVAWPLTRLPGNEDLASLETRDREQAARSWARWDVTLARRLLLKGMDASAILAMMGRYARQLPTIAGVESRHSPVTGPGAVQCGREVLPGYEIAPRVYVTEAVLERRSLRPGADAAAFVIARNGRVQTLVLPARVQRPPDGPGDVITSPLSEQFDPCFIETAREEHRIARTASLVDASVIDTLWIAMPASILEGGIGLRLTIHRCERSNPLPLNAFETICGLFGLPHAQLGKLGDAVLSATGHMEALARYPEATGRLRCFTRIKPQADAVGACLDAWRPVLPRGLRGLSVTELGDRMRIACGPSEPEPAAMQQSPLRFRVEVGA